jgi:hypothetical protein
VKIITTIFALVTIFTISVRGQGFLNLNFESAYNLPGNPPEPNGALVATANALPNWTAYDDTTPLLDVYYVSNYFFGVASVVELEGGSQALSGDFSVGLYLSGSISQVGLIPDDAESLEFEAQGLGASSLSVTLAGQTLSYSAISEGPGYTVYGANIPAGLDGQNEPLTFGLQGLSGIVLDNIQFSPTSVPEPTAYALIGFGGVLFTMIPHPYLRFTMRATIFSAQLCRSGWMVVAWPLTVAILAPRYIFMDQ